MNTKFLSILILFLSTVTQTHAATAQGVMVKFNDHGALSIGASGTYEFNQTLAASYYSNSAAAPVVTCIGSGINCGSTNQPAAPPTPTADPSYAVTLASAIRCIFLDGGALTGAATYQKSTMATGLNGRGDWTFTYTFNVAPAMASVAAKTAWTLVSSTPGVKAIDVDVAAHIAGESVRKGTKGVGYSFALHDKNGNNRVKNLVLSLNNKVVAKPASKIVQNCKGCLAGMPGAVDIDYVTNAGTHGDTTLLKNGDARTILNSDASTVNDNGGVEGRMLSKAVMTPVTLSLGAGTFVVKLAGQVIGVNAEASTDFTVSKTVTVVAEGCSKP
jgi:hypothetical protein